MANQKKTQQDKKPKTLAILLVLLVASLYSLFAPPLVHGAERSLQITPPILETNAGPGEQFETQISITNRTDDLVTLEAFVRDFVASPEGDAPRILGEEEKSSFSLKNWLLLDQKSFVLAPQEERAVKVTIAVPNDAEPGGHYGLVGFTEPNTEIQEGVSVRAGVATLFLVTVAGAIEEQATISRFSAPSLVLTTKVPLTLQLTNEGNVHLKPAGSIRITNLWGQTVAELPVNDNQSAVLPDSQRQFTTLWHHPAAFGYYRTWATVRITPSGETLTAGPVTIWVFPLRTIGIALLSLVLFILVLYEFEHLLAARRRPRAGEGAA